MTQLNDLGYFHDSIAELLEEISFIVINSLNEKRDYEKCLENAEKIEQEIEDTQALRTVGQVDWEVVRGLINLCIQVIQRELGIVDNHRIVELIGMMEPLCLDIDCIWLYSYGKYNLGKNMMNINCNLDLALKVFMSAEQNIQEYFFSQYSENDDYPHDLKDILNYEDDSMFDTIFDDFVTLRLSIQAKILYCAVETLDEDVLFKYGVEGIKACITLGYHKSMNGLNRLLDQTKYLAAVFMNRLYFKQASHLIDIHGYLSNTSSNTVSQINLVLTYAERFLGALTEHRNNHKATAIQKTHELETLDNLYECQYALPEHDIQDLQHLPYDFNSNETSMKEFIDRVRVLLNFSLIDASDANDWDLLTNHLKIYETETPEFVEPENTEELWRDRINEIKLRFRRCSYQNFMGFSDHQKFCTLTTIDNDLNCILKAIGDQHVMYEEVATMVCANGIILVKEFYLNQRYKNKIQVTLENCETLIKPFRLLQSGLILYMSTQYYQADIPLRMESPQKEHLKMAFDMLKDAKLAYDEYIEYASNEKPTELYEHFQFLNNDPLKTLTVSYNATVLYHQIIYSMFLCSVKLCDRELIQDYGVMGIKSTLYLFQQNELKETEFINALITLSYELLEDNYFTQVNHLMAVATVVVGYIDSQFPKLKQKIRMLRLCYYHTLICQSIMLMEKSSEQPFKRLKDDKDRCDRILLSELVTNEEEGYPTAPTTNTDMIRGYFKSAQFLIKNMSVSTSTLKITTPKYDQNSLLNEIEKHLEATYKKLIEIYENKENIN